MKRAFFLIGSLLASGMVMAQANDATTDARALDLKVPQERIQFRSLDPDVDYRNDPPGTWYGDHSGRSASASDEPGADQAADGKWQVHGSVEAGIGYSKHGGNSNWQAANVNLDKTYINEDGDASHLNLNISVGQGEGPIFGPGYYGDYGRGYYGPGPYGPGPYGRGPDGPPPAW
jgi:hypothetical protein